jgi:hypothetical protein
MLKIIKILTILNCEFVTFSKDLIKNELIANEINFK